LDFCFQFGMGHTCNIAFMFLAGTPKIHDFFFHQDPIVFTLFFIFCVSFYNLDILLIILYNYKLLQSKVISSASSGSIGRMVTSEIAWEKVLIEIS